MRFLPSYLTKERVALQEVLCRPLFRPRKPSCQAWLGEELLSSIVINSRGPRFILECRKDWGTLPFAFQRHPVRYALDGTFPRDERRRPDDERELVEKLTIRSRGRTTAT